MCVSDGYEFNNEVVTPINLVRKIADPIVRKNTYLLIYKGNDVHTKSEIDTSHIKFQRIDIIKHNIKTKTLGMTSREIDDNYILERTKYNKKRSILLEHKEKYTRQMKKIQKRSLKRERVKIIHSKRERIIHPKRERITKKRNIMVKL